jgi:5-methylcytosine-specific restriction endonuclease McrA
VILEYVFFGGCGFLILELGLLAGFLLGYRRGCRAIADDFGKVLDGLFGPVAVGSDAGASQRNRGAPTMGNYTAKQDGKRRCRSCGEEFPATTEYFYKHGDRLTARCKINGCHREYKRGVRAANVEHYREYGRSWAGEHRAQMRVAYRNWRAKSGGKAVAATRQWLLENREKVQKTSAVYRDRNAETLKEYQKRYRREHGLAHRIYESLRRARKRLAGGHYTGSDITELLEKQSGCCAYCGVSLVDGYHIDHVVPISRGGSNWPENLALACPRCNDSKGSKLLSEWKP